MKVRALKLCILCITLICLTLIGLAGGSVSKTRIVEVNTGIADTDTFVSSYQKWQAQRVSTGADRYLTMSAGWVKGLSAEDTIAEANIRIDLSDGTTAVRAKDLPKGEWEFWLIENHKGPNYSTLPDAGDGKINLGSFTSDGKRASFDARIDTNTLANFRIDRVVITRAGADPSEFVLTGAPGLFERLALNYVDPVTTAAAAENELNGSANSLLDSIMPASVQATGTTSTATLIATGRTLFLKQTFNGNGRSCATCHPEDNNFTIDPKYISTLASNNPLFVAEFNSALSKNFENPQLMRKFGLILVNADGFDNLANKFTLRSVPHTLALSTSIAAPDPALQIDFTTNGNNPNPAQRLGWSGDGAPGAGRLRDFAIGAIVQHFPKTLARKAGSDFRLPTDAELDALEAFQLSLGRKEDINIRTLVVKNSLASNGKALFLDTGAFGEPGHKNCNACHINAGASTGIGDFSQLLDSLPLGFNSNQATAVNRLPGVAANKLPADGGFGRLLLPDGAYGNFGFVPGVGDIPVQEFNSPPLIEAADTAPFFHNHLVTSLEESVAFYGSDAFQHAPDSIGNLDAGGVIPVSISSNPNDPQVQAISAFLRVLNVVENIRSSVSIELRAQAVSDSSKKDLIKLAIHDNLDAINVAKSGALTSQLVSPSVGTAFAKLVAADGVLKTALALPTSQNSTANSLLNTALQLQRDARAALVDTNTLPASFRN